MYKFKYETFTERTQIFNDNKDKFFIEEQNLFEGNYLIFSDEEPVENSNCISELDDKISTLEVENKNLKIEQEQQNEEILVNMLAITDMYELNKSSNTLISEFNTSKVPTYIQSTYQKLYKLGLKAIDEIPFEVRINLKAK